MDGFEKIDLSEPAQNPRKSRTPLEDSMTKRKKFFFPKKTLLVFLAIFLVVLVPSLFLIILPVRDVYKSAMLTQAQGKIAWDAIKKQNVELASTELVKTKETLLITQKKLDGLAYLGLIPIVGSYYSDAQHLTKAGGYGIDAGLLVVNSIKPYADVLGFKGQGSFVMGSAEDRIRLAVSTLGKITPKIDEVAQLLLKARDEVDQVEPSHYPPILGGGKIRNQLEQLKSFTDQGVTFVDQARPLIKVLPELAGDSGEKKYLVLFQNDKELRPTGGFITAYAIFRVEHGVIHVDRSDDIYNLDNSIPNKPKVPAPIAKYFPKVTQLNLRDSNLSPDFIESMKTFRSLYDKAGKKVDVDGIIALDTHVLVSTIKILDDQVEAAGIIFTSKIDKRCDCPQVIYVLEDNISRPVNYVKTGRKDLLGALLYAIMQKALKSSPKLYWGPLFQDVLTQVERKHVLFYFFDKNAQVGMAALHGTGQILPFDGDYLHINQTNFGGNKANLYVDETVVLDTKTESDGSLVSNLTINYKNPHAPSDCNLERGGLCLNADFRDWIRVYVPKGSVLIDSKGSEVKVTTGEDLGKTVFEGFLTVRPQGSATYTLQYKLPFKLKSGSPLPLLIQKQPGTTGNEYTIKVNGTAVQKFPLVTDKEIKLKF